MGGARPRHDDAGLLYLVKKKTIPKTKEKKKGKGGASRGEIWKLMKFM